MLTEAVAYQMMQGNYDRVLQSNVATMYSNLKLYGAQLEEFYKDFLDRYEITHIYIIVFGLFICLHWNSSSGMRLTLTAKC